MCKAVATHVDADNIAAIVDPESLGRLRSRSAQEYHTPIEQGITNFLTGDGCEPRNLFVIVHAPSQRLSVMEINWGALPFAVTLSVSYRHGVVSPTIAALTGDWACDILT